MPEFKPFCAARLKVERSKKHINEFQAALTAFLNTDFYRLSVKADSSGHGSTVEFECIAVPKGLALIVGDAIHNARAALDLIAAQMFREKTGTDSAHIKFPFRNSREALINACAGGDIQKSGANAVALIVDRIRPYKGGDDTLCALHELDISDKHLLLIPHITVVQLRDVYMEDDRNNRITFRSITVDAGRTVNLVKSEGPGGIFKVKKHGQPSFGVLFDKGTPLENQPILSTLVQFTEHVSRTIDAFEAL